MANDQQLGDITNVATAFNTGDPIYGERNGVTAKYFRAIILERLYQIIGTNDTDPANIGSGGTILGPGNTVIPSLKALESALESLQSVDAKLYQTLGLMASDAANFRNFIHEFFTTGSTAQELFQETETALVNLQAELDTLSGQVGAGSDSRIDISAFEIQASSTDLLHPSGGLKRIFLKAIWNYVHPQVDHFYGVEFADEDGNIIAADFDNTATELLAGVQEFTATQRNNSNVLITFSVDWDLIAAEADRIDLVGYEIANSIITKAFVDSSLDGITTGFFDATKNAWNKNYNAIDLCDEYRSKMLSLDDDVNVGFIGDSLLAKSDAVTQFYSEFVKTAPVWSTSYDTLYRLYNLYVFNQPDFFRFDHSSFSEVGTWTDGYELWQPGNIASWSEADKEESNRSRYSQSANASVAFVWDLATHEKSHFIYDLDYRAAGTITLDISAGNGQIEVYNGVAWVEANGYSFSQNIDDTVAVENSGYGLQVNKVRLKFRRVATSGNATLIFTKDGTTDYFFYWGVCFWNGKTIHFHNMARAGQKARKLVKFVRDIEKFDLDVLISQAPIINETIGTTSYTKVVNDTRWFLWGDEAGNLNADSIKNVYPNLNVCVVLPHVQVEGFSGDKPIPFADLTIDPIQLNNQLKLLFVGRTDYSYIDVLSDMLDIASLNGWTLEAAFTGSGNSVVPLSFSSDGKHQNDYGALVWALILYSNLRVS